MGIYSEFTIFGSCVSRDVFRIAQHEKKLEYYARSSLISLLSNPLEVIQKDISLESEFQKGMIVKDFSNTFLEELKQKNHNTFIIDFVDERFDLMKLDNSYVTRSNEFVNGNLENLYLYESFTVQR
ncbi:DUF6270 domain-containing protein [Paenibacillus sp. FSL F4-0087]|uniref:DUF6270 domain-containing protein n=1 Tax=Paenibacillus sp. FSL F4-0087 TaxID=2921368 RepID=UPI00096E13CF|nr:hypothetical protein BK122_03325 [Paenibacillus pabuli]